MPPAVRTASRPRSVQPVKGTNFEPKRVRKARRKVLVRGALGNIIADANMAREDRAEFYRNLRQIKLRRRHLAREMTTLAIMARDLLTEVQRIGDRHPDFKARSLDEARDEARAAYTSLSVAADEFHIFSRVRVYYVKG